MTMAAYVQIRNDVHPDDVAQLDGHRHTIGAISGCRAMVAARKVRATHGRVNR